MGDRIYALRALEKIPGDIDFPELAAFAEQDLIRRQQALAQSSQDLHRVFSSHDMVEEILEFCGEKRGNLSWLLERFDQADPRVMIRLLSDKLNYQWSDDSIALVLHRLIALLDTYPDFIILSTVRDIYQRGQLDDLTRAFLDKHFDAILQMSIAATPSPESDKELSWDIPFEWPEMKAAIFRLRPEYEEAHLRDEANMAKSAAEHRAKLNDESYKHSATWQELETLYESAMNGDRSARSELQRRIFRDKLSIPERAAATYLFGKLSDQPHVREVLAILACRPGDTWDLTFSPIRFEASLALFQLGTPQGWEALVAANLSSPANVLQSFLNEWIESLTDTLSGVHSAVDEHIERYSAFHNRWFRALVV